MPRILRLPPQRCTARAWHKRGRPIPIHAKLPGFRWSARSRRYHDIWNNGNRQNAVRTRGMDLDCVPRQPQMIDAPFLLMQYDLEHQLGLFIRDDLIAWHALNNKQINGEPALKPMVNGIVDQICKKAELLSCRVEREGAVSGPLEPSYS